MTSKRNIILLTIDCLRGDHLSCLGYDKNITPNIDRLASDGILFTKTMSNGGNTFFSVPSFLTSTFPPSCNKSLSTVAEILRNNGYKTVAFNPNPMTFVKVDNKKSIRIDKGFDRYEIMLSNVSKIKLAIGFYRMRLAKILLRKILYEKGMVFKLLYGVYDRSMKLFPWFFLPKEHLNIPTADKLNEEAIKWIKNQKNSFFLWIHYMDVHEPYAPPSTRNKETLYLVTKYRDFPNKLTKNEIEKLHSLYEKQIECTDGAIGSFLDSLKNMEDYEKNVTILTADHGDAFGEHGTLGHGGEFPANVYDEIIHIPLVIHGLEKNVVINRQVQLLDLAPTICEIARISPPFSFEGRSLFDDSERKVISNSECAMSYRTEKYKIIINKSEAGRIEMYDLSKDPDEKNDIYDQNKENAVKLATEMLTTLEKSKTKRMRKHVRERILRNTKSA